MAKKFYQRPTFWLSFVLIMFLLFLVLKISGKTLSITGLSTEYPLNTEVQFTAVASGIGSTVSCTAYANVDIVSSSGQETSRVMGEKQLTTSCVGSPCNSNSPFKITADIVGTYTVKVTYSCVSGIDSKSFTVKSLLPSCSSLGGSCDYNQCSQTGKKILSGNCDTYSSGYLCCGSCTTKADYKCYGGEIWWYNSCGNREIVKEYCTSCVSGTKQCDVLSCVNEGKSCGYDANSEPKCCSGLTCENFQCVSGSSLCTNDCQKDDQSCLGSITTGSKYLATCGNYDSDSCLEYPTDTSKMTNDQQNCVDQEICKEGKCITDYKILCDTKICDDKDENTVDSCVEGGCVFTKKDTCTDKTFKCETIDKTITIAKCVNGKLQNTNEQCKECIGCDENHPIKPNINCLSYQEVKDGECKFSLNNFFTKDGIMSFKDNESTTFWIIVVVIIGGIVGIIHSKTKKQESSF